MTDTTDIAALRELLSHENLESDHHVGVTVTTLRLLLSKADALEAERQRANESGERFYKAVQYGASLEAEIAALKGDQVPYAYSYNYAGCETREGFQDWRKELSRERPPEWMIETGKVTDLVELFTYPQKPVVLPIDEMSYKDACEFVSINGMRNEDRPTLAMRVWNSCRKAAIEAAGGIVSTSDERLMQDMSSIVKDGE